MAMSTLTVPLPWVGQYETASFNLTPALLAAMPAFVMDPTLFVAKVRTDGGSGSGLTRRNDPDVRAAVVDVLEAALQGAGMPVPASQDYAARIVNTGPDSYNRAAGIAARIVVLAQVDAAGGNATIGPAIATFAASATPGSNVFTITGLATGETLTSISPNDGRVRLSSTGGVVGLSASTAGIVEYTVKTSFNREHTVSVTVTGTGGALAISGSLGSATVGSAYSFTPTVTGGSGTKSFSLSGTLPAGLSFSALTGALTGTPTTAGTTSGLAITVTDSSGSATLSGLSIVVSSGGTAPTTRVAFLLIGQSHAEYIALRGGPPQTAAITLAQDVRTLANTGRSAPFASYDLAKTIHDGSSQTATDWTVRIENVASGGSALIDTADGGSQIGQRNFWYNSPGRDNSAATGDPLDNNSAGSDYSPGPLARAARDRMQAFVAAGGTFNGVLHSQGGTDAGGFATDPVRAAAYQQVLSRYFDDLRSWASAPSLPIFIQKIARHWVAGEADTEVLRTIQRTLIATKSRVYAGAEEYPHRNAVSVKLPPVATITAGSNVITTTNTGNIIVGQGVIGPGIPAGAYASAVTTNASITLVKMTNGVVSPANATASASNAVIYQRDSAHLYPGVNGTEPYDDANGTGYVLDQGYHLLVKQLARRIAQVLAFPNAPTAALGPAISGGSYTRGTPTLQVQFTHFAGTDFAAGQVFDTAGWRVESNGTVFPVTLVTKSSATTLALTVSRPLYPSTDAGTITVQYGYGAMNKIIATQLVNDNASPVPFPIQALAPSGIVVTEPGYAARSQRIFTVMQNLGVAPGANRRAAIDNRVRARESVNAYGKGDRDVVLAAHAQAAALINWANPEDGLVTLVGSPTFTVDRGFTGPTDASTKIDLAYNPTAGGTLLTLNDAHVSAFVLFVGNFSSPDVVDAGARLNLRARNGGVGLIRMNSATSTSFNDAVNVPMRVSGIRRDAANQIGYRNGAPVMTGAVASTSLATATQLVLSDRVIATLELGAAPDDATMLALYQADLAYLRAIGAVAYP